MARCILDTQKICNHCGVCDDRCELDPFKVCDNCFCCLESDDRDYAEIMITDVLTELDATAFDPANLALDWTENSPRPRTLHGVHGRYKNKKH